MPRSTTILGRAFPGRPMFGSLALDLYLTEQKHGRDKARALLDARNRVRGVFRESAITLDDLAADMTPLPLEGLETCPAGGRHD